MTIRADRFKYLPPTFWAQRRVPSSNLGYAYIQNKENEKAIHAFENALELDQSNDKAYYNLQQLRENQEK